MAITLNDIKKSKKVIQEKKKDSVLDENKSLRPWEGYEHLGLRTRTVMAQEAVKKAQSIVENNKKMVEELQSNYHLSKFNFDEISSSSKIKSEYSQIKGLPPRNRSGILGLIKDILEL
ncbi:MAG: hypothetical protein OEY33_05910 [Bdellovibrionales bacterium]|jgi:hypothetical protein|nr:hypothetical protein [Bdellovibrionales bacterium]